MIRQYKIKIAILSTAVTIEYQQNRSVMEFRNMIVYYLTLLSLYSQTKESMLI